MEKLFENLIILLEKMVNSLVELNNRVDKLEGKI